MRRKILFRGKVKEIDLETCPEDGWVWGYYRQDISGGELRHYIFNCPVEWEVIPESVGQYVGVCDDDGRKIFEGDVVRCCYEIPTMGLFGGAVVEEEEYIGVVEYRGGSFYIGKHSPLENFRPDEMEVIGNIFDNPDLLNSKSK